MSAGPAKRPIVLASGGTGGHMFPAAALARELLSRGERPVLITDARGGGFGPDLADQVPTYRIAAAGFAGGDPLAKLGSLLRLGVGYLQARAHLRHLDPVSVVGFGGYASLPTALAAAHTGRRLILHEQNAVLGRANRMLAGRASALALSFPEVSGLDSDGRAKACLTGNPVRSSFVAIGRKPYAVADQSGPLRLLVTGGSQGARVFNDLIPDMVQHLPQTLRARLSVSQQVRGTDLEAVRRRYEGSGVQPELRSFFDDLPERLQGVHLVIARAGASTVTELTAAGRPSILVPYPFAADDHQRANARALESAGAAWLHDQKTLTPELLAREVAALLADPARLSAAARAALGFAVPDSAARLAALVLGTDNGGNRAAERDSTPGGTGGGAAQNGEAAA